jgi:hypothetical protein
MKKIIISVVIFLTSLAGYSQLNLLEGTPIKVKTVNELSSRKAQVGDIVYFRLVDNLKIDSIAIIDTTAEIMGEVIEAGKARSLGRPGKLDFTIDNVKAIDGQNIRLRTTPKKITGKDKTGGVVAAAVIFAPVALFLKGKEVVIEANKEFIVYVDSDYTIKTPKNREQ